MINTTAATRARRAPRPNVAAPVPTTNPAATSASGHTSESESPTPRSVRIAAQTSITVPEMRRLRGGGAQPGAGSNAQAPRYARIPAPLANARNAKVSRTSVASTARDSAMPAATPATTRSRSTRAIGAWSATGNLSARELTADDRHPAEADAGVEHEHATAVAIGVVEARVHRGAFVDTAEDHDLAATRAPVDVDRHAGGNVHGQVADPDRCFHVRLAGRQRHVGEVHLEVADPERVLRVERADGRRMLDAVADAREERHPDGDGQRERGQHEDGQADHASDRAACSCAGGDGRTKCDHHPAEDEPPVDVPGATDVEEREHARDDEQCSGDEREEARAADSRQGLGRHCVARRRAPSADLPPHERGTRDRRGEPHVAGIGPDARLAEGEDADEREQREPDGAARTVALALQRDGHDRVLLALLGNDEPGGNVEEDPRAPGERERDEGDPVDRGVEVEVGPEPGGDAAEPAPVARPRQASRLADRFGGFHGVRLPCRRSVDTGSLREGAAAIREAPRRSLSGYGGSRRTCLRSFAPAARLPLRRAEVEQAEHALAPAMPQPRAVPPSAEPR